MPLISVVLPVYDEGESIAACLRGLSAALSAEEHEILVIYDFEEDTTLPAIAAMPDRPPGVRLVRNTLGRGALNAIRAGFAAASGDVVVTSMADLSDPPEVIPRMARAIRAGADVVSGSRYMRGGSQTGGPWLKRTFSRLAGLSLHWIAGLGTRDATTNFRAYSRSFLQRVEIESRGGFEIGLELTVKAHLSGGRVAEVPSSWVDRESGQSRFRMWRWMPSYLRWYLRAMAAPVLVGLAWIAMLASAHHYIAAYSSPVPHGDELSLMPLVAGDTRLTPGWYWSQHNEHRIPLPRLVYVGLMKLTHDHDSLMYAQVYLLAALSLGLTLAAQRIRGRTSVTDAFFAFLFLHLGHHGNWLAAFQIALVLPAALSCAIAMLVAAGPTVPDRRTGFWVGSCLLALPLCGGAGLLQVPPIALWIGLAGLTGWRSRDPARRRSAPLLLAVTAAIAALIGLYLWDYHTPVQSRDHSGFSLTLSSALRYLSMSLGPTGTDFWPVTGCLLVGFCLFTTPLLLATWRAHPEERWREAGMIACGLGALTLALGIGWGRGLKPGSGAALRYVTLASPFLGWMYLVWCRYATGAAGRLVRACLCLTMGALAGYDVGPALSYGRERVRAADDLVRDVEAGLVPEELAARHWRSFFGTEEGFATHLEQLRRQGLAPYREPVSGDEPDMNVMRPFFYWKVKPVDSHSDEPISRRKVDGVRVVLIHAPGEIVLEIPPDARRARGGFGIHPLAYQSTRRRTDGVLFRVERALAPGAPEVLFEKLLDPVGDLRDVGFHSFAVEVRGGAGEKLFLCVSNPPGRDNEMDWGFWTEIEFD